MSARASSARSSARNSKRNSTRNSRRASMSSAKPRVSIATEELKDTSEGALVKSNTDNVDMELKEPFSDDCERYQQDCCCCHCIAVRCAFKKLAFLRSPEGRQRLEMKLHMKSFFMDINALTHARCRIENQLDASKPSQPSPHRDGYPTSITSVKRIDSGCLSIDWFIHDTDYVDHYEILVDSRRHKRIFNPELKSTILLDVNARMPHKILMRAVPRKSTGSDPNPVDLLVRDVCCGRMDKVLIADYFCQCDKLTEMEKIEKSYKKNKCQTLVDFFKPSEFLYTPTCTCSGSCDCECFT